MRLLLLKCNTILPRFLAQTTIYFTIKIICKKKTESSLSRIVSLYIRNFYVTYYKLIDLNQNNKKIWLK